MKKIAKLSLVAAIACASAFASPTVGANGLIPSKEVKVDIKPTPELASKSFGFNLRAFQEGVIDEKTFKANRMAMAEILVAEQTKRLAANAAKKAATAE